MPATQTAVQAFTPAQGMRPSELFGDFDGFMRDVRASDDWMAPRVAHPIVEREIGRVAGHMEQWDSDGLPSSDTRMWSPPLRADVDAPWYIRPPEQVRSELGRHYDPDLYRQLDKLDFGIEQLRARAERLRTIQTSDRSRLADESLDKVQDLERQVGELRQQQQSVDRRKVKRLDREIEGLQKQQREILSAIQGDAQRLSDAQLEAVSVSRRLSELTQRRQELTPLQRHAEDVARGVMDEHMPSVDALSAFAGIRTPIERQAAETAEPQKVNHKRVDAALRCIPAHDRGVWLKVGAALKDQCGKDGYFPWCEWSKTAPDKYNEADQWKTWGSLKRTAADGQIVTVNTLFDLAIKNGWRNYSTADEDFHDVYEKPALATGGKLLEYPDEISLDEIKQRQASAMIKGHIHPADMVMLYGETTAGKTFVALDAAWHIALGRDWHGFKVKQAPVLYVALEGVAGFRKRVLALRTELGETGRQFSRFAIRVSLVRAAAGKDGADAIVKAAQELGAAAGRPVGFVVIDTLARAMAGDDENSTADMMHFVEQRAGYIAHATGAAVLTVHHPNKAGSARGSSSASPSFDTIWRIDLHGNRRTLVGEKVKDGAEGPMFDFQLKPVLLGIDDDGDDMDTCVVQSAPASAAPTKPVTVHKHVKVFHDAFDAALEAGHAVEARVELAAVRKQFMDRYTVLGAKPEAAQETKERMWRKALTGLCDEYESGEHGGVMRLWRRSIEQPFKAA